MAGLSRGKLAMNFLIELKKKHGSVVPLSVLRNGVIMDLGADEKRTLLPYLQLMRETGMIKETMHGWEITVSEETK